MAALWSATGWYKSQHLGEESPAKPFRDGDTEPHAWFQWPTITSSREDMHAARVALMNRAATRRALSQEFGSFRNKKYPCEGSMTFAAIWTLISETMAAAALDAASQIGTILMM
ncbi:hypothetical protein TNCV_1600091 [Trichonephila clavipes]|nr:hypothetical protein TNCV_1600091 [Trichonephila clavipes]